MRIAYLIIAHNEFDVLRRLVSALDDTDNDIYIHIDQKVKQLPEIETQRSRLFMIKDRLDVRWGHVSQIKCEYRLWEEAYQKAQYDFYVLLSGAHLPLKPVEVINGFFESNRNRNILPFYTTYGGEQKILKLNRLNLFVREAFYGPDWKQRLFQLLWKSAIRIEKILRIQINRDCVFYHSSNWVALSESGVSFMLSRKRTVLKKYRYSFCGDEWFVATELTDSPLRDTITDCDNYLLCTIGRAHPVDYKLSEYDDLCKSDYLFARKFRA